MMIDSDKKDRQYMQMAIEAAKIAEDNGDVPIGAVIVCENRILAKAYNQREQLVDPTAHAEIIALTQAATAMESWRLHGCTIYVTLEPCPMCAGALVLSRIDRLVYGCDAFAQVLEIVASVTIFWVPLAAYLMYKIFWQLEGANSPYDPKTDIVFWLLLGYGIFFFPMGLLAIAMFNSSSAYNPFLWIMSILSTFFQYCGLVLFFCVLGWLVLRVVSSFEQSRFFSYLFGAAFVYLAMVAAHLLGRFYYLNSKELNWDV